MSKDPRIGSKSLHIKELKSHFAQADEISVENLINFYKRFERDVNRSTIDWRIYQLNQKGILHRISRGTYSLGESRKNQFIPELNRSLKDLYCLIRKQFPFIRMCVWSTKWLNEFMRHQPGRFFTILETEKEVAESVFYALKEARKEVYLNPSEEMLSKYALGKTEPIIITHLISEAPTQQVDNVDTTTLEKMLVDIYCDTVLFAAQQGAELKRIYKNGFEKYQVSEGKMLRYASRRNKKAGIEERIREVSKKRQ